LLISRAKYEIDVLLNLGYTHSAISNVLNVQLLVILGLSYAAIVFVLISAFRKLAQMIAEKGFEMNGMVSPKVILAGGGIVLLLMLINNITLRMTLRK